MELSVLSSGKASSKVMLSDQHFARAFNEGLVHQVVNACLAGERQGSSAQKTRAERRGGGIKPWRQKGTGRARAGSSRSPIWRKGGVTFASKQRDYSQKVNRKAYRAALSSVLSELIRHDRLIVVDSITVPAPKTKDLIAQLKQLPIESALIIVKEEDINLQLSARNLPDVHVSTVSGLYLVDLIAFDHVVITVDALKKLEEKFV